MSDAESIVSGLFRDINAETAVLERYKARYSKYLASGFNALDMCRVNLKENLISDIICSLLNPDGSHGQGDIFLRLFLGIVKARCRKGNEEKCMKNSFINFMENSAELVPSIHREYNAGGRRIDILLNFGDFALGIENKPYACEQQNQLHDYDKFLDKKWPGRYALIFLSEFSPRTENREKGVIKLKYHGENSLLSWLEECRRSCESQRVRYFIEDVKEITERNIAQTNEEENDDQPDQQRDTRRN